MDSAINSKLRSAWRIVVAGLLAIGLLQLGTQLSLWVSLSPGLALWYLPVPIGIALIHWWGPAVLPLVFINATLSAGLWGLERTELWPVYAWPETLEVALSWLLVRKPNWANRAGLIRFLLLGIILPVGIGAAAIPVQLWLLGDIGAAQIIPNIQIGISGDFLAALTLSLPFMVFLTPIANRIYPVGIAMPLVSQAFIRRTWQHPGFVATIGAIIALAWVWPIWEVWWLYGLLMISTALTFGFRAAVFTNGVVVVSAYLIPSVGAIYDLSTLWEINLGSGILCITGLLAARITDDLRQEISVRAETQQALTDSENRNRKIVESMPGLYFLLDSNCVYIDYQAGSVGDLVAPPEVFLGRRVIDIIPGKIGEEIEAAIQTCLKKRTIQTFNYSVDTPDGALQHYEARLVPYANQVMIFSQDISERRKTEEALNQAQKMESLGVLAGGIAHDFNNLLGGLLGYIDLIRLKTGPEGMAATADEYEKMITVLKRARSLTDQLLTFARGGDPIMEPGDIRKCAMEAINFAMSGSSCEVVYEMDESMHPCSFDAHQLPRVFENIAINARQAMPHGGVITVTGTNVTAVAGTQGGLSNIPGLQPGDYVKISIADRGPGIDPQEAERIFEPFYSHKDGGTGLGLATSRSIVTKHGGTIELQSETGRGAEFSVYIPADFQSRAQANVINPRRNQPVSVLLMDDETAILDITRTYLTMAGHQVTVATNGLQAFDLYRRAFANGNPFQIAFLDLTVVGGTGGKETAQKILQFDAQAKLVASSGYSEDPIIARPNDFGFQASITKPYSSDELLAVLNIALVHEETIGPGS